MCEEPLSLPVAGVSLTRIPGPTVLHPGPTVSFRVLSSADDVDTRQMRRNAYTVLEAEGIVNSGADAFIDHYIRPWWNFVNRAELRHK